MNFPFWYTGEVVFYKSDNINVSEAVSYIVSQNKGKAINNKLIHFQGNKGVFGLPSRIRLLINTEGATIHINYYQSLFESNILLLFGILFSAYFFIYNHVEYSVIALLVGIGVYASNALKVNLFAKELVAKFGSLTKNIEQQKLWELQQIWIKDVSVCPACGEKVNPYSANCVNCGLHFKGKLKKRQNSGTNNTTNQRIKYNFKKTKK